MGQIGPAEMWTIEMHLTIIPRCFQAFSHLPIPSQCSVVSWSPYSEILHKLAATASSTSAAPNQLPAGHRNGMERSWDLRASPQPFCLSIQICPSTTSPVQGLAAS